MSRMPSRQIAANRRSFHRCTQGGDGGRANADSSSNHSAPASFGTSRAAVAIGTCIGGRNRAKAIGCKNGVTKTVQPWFRANWPLSPDA